MSIKDLSLELAAVSLLADEAKKAKDRLREALQAEMEAIGADRVKADYQGQQIAFITTSQPKFKWSITNDRKFVEWVKSNIPSEIVETVRESSIDAILGKFKLDDETVIDPNGEIVDWLIGTISDPYLMTKFAADGRDTLKKAFMDNQLEFKKMWELE